MEIRTLVGGGGGPASQVPAPTHHRDAGQWMWIDIVATESDTDDLLRLTSPFGLDEIAVRDSVIDLDHPKVDDFAHHLLLVLHGLMEDAVATYEVDCFLAERQLITIRNCPSPALDSLFGQVQQRADLASIPVDELTAVLADLLTRRLLAVLEAFDERVEDLTDKALRADTGLLEDLTAVRTDLAGVRRVVHPQREALDVLRHSNSPLLSDGGRRRFSDVFDVASRLADGLDEARSALAETLDAYRGAEARQATEVTKVLTVYAAIMLPLSLVAGIFGMNFGNLPWLQRSWGWVAAAGIMFAIAVVSLGVFVSLGWVRRPSSKRAGEVLGRGLLEATRAPVQIVGAVVEASTMPLREVTAHVTARITGRDDARAEDPPARAP